MWSLRSGNNMKGKVGMPITISAAVALGVGVMSSIAEAKDIGKATNSQIDASSFAYARLYCTQDNESHFSELTAALTKQNFAPPAAQIYIGGNQQASGVFLEDSRRTGVLPTW